MLKRALIGLFSMISVISQTLGALESVCLFLGKVSTCGQRLGEDLAL